MRKTQKYFTLFSTQDTKQVQIFQEDELCFQQFILLHLTIFRENRKIF